MVGTDDGLIHVTRDGGRNWRRIEDFPRVPELTRISRVVFSRHDEGTIFATFDGHKDNSFVPYVYRSTDYGESWTSITGDLPDFGSTRVVREHPHNPNLLFVGTEFGVFVSITGGDQWVQLKNNLPTIGRARHGDPPARERPGCRHARTGLLGPRTTSPRSRSSRRRFSRANSALFSVRPAMQFNYFNRGRRLHGIAILPRPETRHAALS